MSTLPQSTAPVSGKDNRWKLVEATMRKHGYERHALIQSLHTVQETFGYIDDQAMRFVAEKLKVALSQVYGVATFYHFFSLKPQGRHTCVVCTGTACYIRGSRNILDAVYSVAKINAGETTEDGQVSLLSARCLGSCGLAPAVVFDGEVAGKVAPDTVINRLQTWMRGEVPPN